MSPNMTLALHDFGQRLRSCGVIDIVQCADHPERRDCDHQPNVEHDEQRNNDGQSGRTANRKSGDDSAHNAEMKA